MTDKAKFKYSAQDGTVELEGSEEFVSQHFESLTEIVRLISRNTVVEQKKEKTELVTESSSQANVNPAQVQKPSNQETIYTYPHIFSEINGKLKIVVDIPGNNKSHQMTNAAILYCYGSRLLGDEQVSSTEIRSVCEEHGILDGPNFSKIFSDKTLFLVDGVKGGNKQVKLTFQGNKRATELLNDDSFNN